MPANRKLMNLEIILSNLSEAVEELQRLAQKAAKQELSEGEFQVGLRHAYHHLNFAWQSTLSLRCREGLQFHVVSAGRDAAGPVRHRLATRTGRQTTGQWGPAQAGIGDGLRLVQSKP
jgi:hypothetical protein